MGVSTDAILAYGYDLGDGIDWEDDNEDDDDNDGWDEGDGDIISKVQSKLRKELVGYDDSEYNYKAEQKADEATGIEVVSHCSNEYPMAFVAAAGSVTTANRGYPQRIDSLTVDPTWDATVRKALAALGVQGEPGWHIFSDWG